VGSRTVEETIHTVTQMPVSLQRGRKAQSKKRGGRVVGKARTIARGRGKKLKRKKCPTSRYCSEGEEVRGPDQERWRKGITEKKTTRKRRRKSEIYGRKALERQTVGLSDVKTS